MDWCFITGLLSDEWQSRKALGLNAITLKAMSQRGIIDYDGTNCRRNKNTSMYEKCIELSYHYERIIVRKANRRYGMYCSVKNHRDIVDCYDNPYSLQDATEVEGFLAKKC